MRRWWPVLLGGWLGLSLPGARAWSAALADPLLQAGTDTAIHNLEAMVPPQCYTATGARSNPCWTCHTERNGRNALDDWHLQQKYAFSDFGRTNHWLNLFKDRRAAIAATGDAEALAWVRTDNYAPLRRALATRSDFPGWKPDLDYSQGFDADGFARDGSGWRAYRYKPFPGTFWPTNGSTDDAFVRLPAIFRQDAQGRPSRAVYQANLALVEALVSVPDTVADTAFAQATEALDEAAAGADLDGDGRVGGLVQQLRGLPAHFFGAASAVPAQRYAYPAGVEFMHSVRYLDPQQPDMMAARMKELRYAIKLRQPTPVELDDRYAHEALEKDLGELPNFTGSARAGLGNGYGWRWQGYIEDRQGALRLQTREEQMYCLGCHSATGVAVDQTFSLPRKPPGAAGWGLQTLAGMQDQPQAGSAEPEILRYLDRVGAGDEFRANAEMLQRFFPQGRLDRARVLRSAPGAEDDLRALILPSPARALALDKAYMQIVAEQSYTEGRDAVLAPVRHVHRQITHSNTQLQESGRVYRDGRLWLDWSPQPTVAAARPLPAQTPAVQSAAATRQDTTRANTPSAPQLRTLSGIIPDGNITPGTAPRSR